MKTLDLHDYNLEDAYQECQEFIAEAYKDHIKKIEDFVTHVKKINNEN